MRTSLNRRGLSNRLVVTVPFPFRFSVPGHSILVAGLLALLAVPLAAQTGTVPEEGIQSRPSRVTLFRDAHVVISPDRELSEADLLVRDDKIAEVAVSIEPPVDAQIIECEGKYLYPAFIDPLVEQSLPSAERPNAHWNAHVQPHRQAYTFLPSDDKVAAQYRRAGFGTILIAPSDGILKGSSAVVTTAKLPAAKTALRPQAFQHLALVLGRSERAGYPNSPMGVVALTRQTFSDAQWYQQAQQAFHADPSLPAPDTNVALEALGPLVRGEQAVIVDSGNELYALRADRMAREFTLRAVIRGSGREYRRLDELAALDRTFIVPVDFPKPPEVASIDAASVATLQSLMHWHLAPENPGRMAAAHVNFVLTANGLTAPTDLLESLRKAIARGLSERDALTALTVRSAQLLEVDHLVGSLERGKLANLLLTSGPLWEKKSTIEETWVQGERYRWQDRSKIDPSGRWKLKLTGDGDRPKQLELQLENMTDKPKGRIALAGELSKSDDASKAKATASATTASKAKPSAPETSGSDDKPEKPLELKKPTSDVPPKDDNPQPDKADVPASRGESTAKPKEGNAPSKTTASAAQEPNAQTKTSDKADGKSKTKSDESPQVVELKQLSISDFRIEALFPMGKLTDDDEKGAGRLSLTVLVEDDEIESLIGRIQWPDGHISTVTATLVAKPKEQQQDKKDRGDEDADRAEKEESSNDKQVGVKEDSSVERSEATKPSANNKQRVASTEQEPKKKTGKKGTRKKRARKETGARIAPEVTQSQPAPIPETKEEPKETDPKKLEPKKTEPKEPKEKPSEEKQTHEKQTHEKQAEEKQPEDKADKKADEKQASDAEEKDSDDEEFICEINYPLGAFGVARPPEQHEWVLLRDATIWTCDAPGLLESADLLIHRGLIEAVGQNLTAPEGAEIIDAQGKHISPGIIDCHSHMATDGGVNESGQAVTSEVCIGDFIDCNDMSIYWQLAGGVTIANVLHGSANPIGGQNQVIKLRWGAIDDEMKMREAPPGIKFALGENVKQSNWGERASGRYPQTRMGVEQIMRDRFEAAKLYREAHSSAGKRKKTLPPRRDYELEAIVEILEHRRWIHCHSYRQDEILAFLRTLEDYDVTVGSLQHILEGYKVADVLAKHGATASTFSDWWAYKVEVTDAIPYNGALMHQAGIIVSFNSDDNELARHLNHEAAKAVKYGGVLPEEALKFVTLNPAKQLRIDQYVGSLAPGKQADFVVWNGSPLSTLSRCEQTWIDGKKYFDRDIDAQEREKASSLHRQLVQRILDSGEKMLGDGRDRRDPSLWFHRHDEFCNHSRQDEVER